MALRDEILADSPSNYWEFNETSGTTLTATTGGATMSVVGSVALNQAGPAGTKSVRSVTLGYMTSNYADFFANTNWTLEFWFKVPTGTSNPGGGGGGFPTLMRRDGNGRAMLVRYRPTGAAGGAGVEKFETYMNARARWSSVNINDGAWHHYVAARTGTSTLIEYLDGVATTWNGTETGSLNLGALGTANPLYILAEGINYGTGTDLSIANLAMYDTTALSGARVTAHYNAGLVTNTNAGYTAQLMTGTATMGDHKYANATVNAAPMFGTATMPGAVYKKKFYATTWAQFKNGANETEGTRMMVGETTSNTANLRGFAIKFNATEEAPIKSAKLYFTPAYVYRSDATAIQVNMRKPTSAWSVSTGEPSSTSITSFLVATTDLDTLKVITINDLTPISDGVQEYLFKIGTSWTTSNGHTVYYYTPEDFTESKRPYLEVEYAFPDSQGVQVTASAMTASASMPSVTVDATDTASVPAVCMTATAAFIMPATPSANVNVAAASGSAAMLPAVGLGMTHVAVGATLATGTGTMQPVSTSFITNVNYQSEIMRATSVVNTPLVNGASLADLGDPYYVLTRQNTDYDDLWYRFKEVNGATAVADELRRVPGGPIVNVHEDKDGQLVGNPEFGPAFGNHRAMIFDGIDDYITVPDAKSSSDPPYLLPGSTEFYIRTTGKNQPVMTGRGYDLPIDSVGFIGQGDVIRNTSIELEDGKVKVNTFSTSTFGDSQTGSILGNIDIADGEWHQIVLTTWWYGDRLGDYGVTSRREAVQDYELGNTTNGMSIYVDGKLDIRKHFSLGQSQWLVTYIANPDTIGRIGNKYFKGDLSELVHRTWLSIPKYYIEQAKYAFFQDNPIKSDMQQVVATMPDHKGRGNAKRVLVLYFNPGAGAIGLDNEWSTAITNTEFPFGGLTAPIASQNWDIDDAVKLFPGAAFFFKNVYYSGNINRVESYYRDAVTNEPRYINLQTDIDATDFDTLMFVDFPGVEYENNTHLPHRNRGQLFDNFIESVRTAVFDEGLNLYIAAPHLAQALGLVNGWVSKVPHRDSRLIPTNTVAESATNEGYRPGWDWRMAYNDPFKNPHARPGGNEEARIAWANDHAFEYWDTHTNKKHRIVNKVDGITNIPGYTFDEELQWTDFERTYLPNSSQEAFRYTDHPNGLEINDEFMMNGPVRDTHAWPARINQPDTYRLISFRPDQIRTGTVLAQQQLYLNDEKLYGIPYDTGGNVLNPDRDNATVIIIEPGAQLDGRTINGKIVIDPNDTYRYNSVAYIQNPDDPGNFIRLDETTETRKWNAASHRIKESFSKVNFTSYKVVTGANGATAVLVEETSRDISQFSQLKATPVRLVEMSERLWTWLLETEFESSDGDVRIRAAIAVGTATAPGGSAGAVKNITVIGQTAHGFAQAMGPAGSTRSVQIYVTAATASGIMHERAIKLLADTMTATGVMTMPMGLEYDTEDTIYMTIGTLGSAILIKNGDSR